LGLGEAFVFKVCWIKSPLLVYRVVSTHEDGIYWPEGDIENLPVALNREVRAHC